jgi:capsule polysaccharide export protein KpsE/RkpR
LNGYLRTVQFLLRHRRFIIWAVALATVGTAVFSLVTPSRFRSAAQVLPPSDEQDLLSAASLIQSTNLSRMIRAGGTLRGGTSADLLAAIVHSRTVQERVIEDCDYKKEYRLKKPGVEDALKLLNKATAISATDEGLVRVSVEARTPALAARLANAYVSETDRFLRESNMSRSHNVRVFIEKRVIQADSELTAAAESLVQFQDEHKLVALDEETKASVEAYAKLKAQELSYDFESGVADRVMQPDNPYSQQLRRQSTEMRRQLSAFENGSGLPGFGIGSSVPLRQLPGVAARYVQLLADYKLKQELKALLVQQFEEARIKEVRDTPTISILDEGRIPEQRSYPKRTRMTLTAFFVSLIVAVSLAAAFDGIRAGTRAGLESPESSRFLSGISRESKLTARIVAFFTGAPDTTHGPKSPPADDRQA